METLVNVCHLQVFEFHVLILPMRNGNFVFLNFGGLGNPVLILPMRNGNESAAASMLGKS